MKRICTTLPLRVLLHCWVLPHHLPLVFWKVKNSIAWECGCWHYVRWSRVYSYCGHHKQKVWSCATWCTLYLVRCIISWSRFPGNWNDWLNVEINVKSQIYNQIQFSFFSNSATVAKRLKEDSFALIFGINTLVALLFQSLLTYIVITVLSLPIRVQYHVYSFYFFFLAIFYGCIGIVNFIYKRKWNNDNGDTPNEMSKSTRIYVNNNIKSCVCKGWLYL